MNAIQFIKNLNAKGIQIEDSQNYEYGKFAWIKDPDGNKVELSEEE